LCVRDLRLDTAHPVVYLHGKGGKTRIVPLLARTAEHCRQHLRRCHRDEPASSDAFVFFTTIHGQRQPVSADTVAAFLNAYAQSAGATCPEMPKRVHPHMLRHYVDGWVMWPVGVFPLVGVLRGLAPAT